MAQTSVEQYRETDKTATAICQELDVTFLLEGGFQKYCAIMLHLKSQCPSSLSQPQPGYFLKNPPRQMDEVQF